MKGVLLKLTTRDRNHLCLLKTSLIGLLEDVSTGYCTTVAMNKSSQKSCV